MMRMRRGQMEMVGLVIVVVVLILGILLYLYFSSERDTSANNIKLATTAKQAQSQSSLLLAMSQMTIPACGDMQFNEVAKACKEGERVVCDDPCEELQKAMNTIVEVTQMEGRKYNLTLAGTDVHNISDCPSAIRGRRIAQYPQPISFGNGRGTQLTLDICR